MLVHHAQALYYIFKAVVIGAVVFGVYIGAGAVQAHAYAVQPGLHQPFHRIGLAAVGVDVDAAFLSVLAYLYN